MSNIFGPAFEFVHQYKKDFWELYYLLDKRPKAFSRKDRDAIQSVGDKAADEGAKFLADLSSVLQKKAQEMDLVCGTSQKTTRVNYWRTRCVLKNKSKIDLLTVQIDLTDNFQLIISVLANCAPNRAKLLDHWRLLKANFAKNIEGCEEEWDLYDIVFPPIPIKDLSSVEPYKKEVTNWFETAFKKDKKWIKVIET